MIKLHVAPRLAHSGVWPGLVARWGLLLALAISLSPARASPQAAGAERATEAEQAPAPEPELSGDAWPGLLPVWPAEARPAAHRAVRLLAAPDTQCREVHTSVLHIVSQGGLAAGLATGAVYEMIQQLALQVEAGEDVPYATLFRELVAALQSAWEVVQLLSLASMVHKGCFLSAARQAMGKALLPLQAAVQQQIANMWWMFDIGQYSNTNSPGKHFKAVHNVLQFVEGLFEQLSIELPLVLPSTEIAWGHEDHGMFMNSTVLYRKLFPNSAIVDKGLLRCLLRLLPRDHTLADFGALDGHYARWLNDTGWVTAYAFDGIQGVAELTDGLVTEVDLAGTVEIVWHPKPFDWVLCLEVAEHIPAHLEGAFLQNLNRYAAAGLVLSWATPDIIGEGHVNCLTLEESRRRVEALGFRQDVTATEALRIAADIPWIAISVAVYRREAG